MKIHITQMAQMIQFPEINGFSFGCKGLRSNTPLMQPLIYNASSAPEIFKKKLLRILS